MRKFLAVLGLSMLIVALGGCRSWRETNCHKPQAYQSARTGTTLKIPEGVDAPDSAGLLKLPVLNEPAPPPRGPKDPCLDQPPPFKVPKAATPQA
jgi:uncharacterized lipoprotein